MIARFILIYCLISLSACGILSTRQGEDGRGDNASKQLILLKPQQYGRELIATQQVSISFGSEKFEYLSRVELSKERLVIVALTPLGQKLFQIVQRGNTIDFRKWVEPIELRPKNLLSDFAMIFSPRDVLEQSLTPTGFQWIGNREGGRVFTVNDDNALAIKITYSNLDPWTGSVLFHHLKFNYQIQINTLSVQEIQL